MKSHREMYPEQYQHELVGKKVSVANGPSGTVERVMPSMFGDLVVLAEIGAAHAFSVDKCKVIS